MIIWNGRRRKRILRGVIAIDTGRGMERSTETERRENAKAGVLRETRVVILMTRKGRKRSIDSEAGIRIGQRVGLMIERELRIGREIETGRGTKRKRRRGRGLGRKIEKEKARRGNVRGRKDRERERMEHEREERERDRDREKRERRTRERGKHRELSSDSGDDSGERDGKRRRRDNDDSKERMHEQSISRSNRHMDNSEESTRKKSGEGDSDKNKSKTREDELEEEQKRLDEEMEKRRRRVQEWQELRRKKEETESEKGGEEANVDESKSGKTWTLEGESDDEEAPPTGKSEMDVDLEENAIPDKEAGDAMVVDTENDISAPQSEGDAANGDEEIDPLDAFMNSMVLPEVEMLNNVVVTQTADDNKADLKKEDKKDGGINGGQRKKGSHKSLGRIIPGEDSDSDHGDLENSEDPLEDEDDDEFMKRVKKTKAEKLSIVDHSKIDYSPFRKNFYIEVKEVSRMTPDEVAAYRKLLELKIHGKDVPKPIKTWHQTGLTSKILETIKKHNYEKPMTIQAQALPIIMSSGVAQQISELKRGTEIVVCTPGRMIDILCTSGGKITNLRRVTYLVETLARKVLNKPVEIQVGGRSVVNKDINQLVEDKCDALFRDLLKFGHPCLSLHGAKDQTDRESTISDFKSNVCNLLIATSVAARGLDVKDLELVVNYDVPNHYEDYVHRVGRTGRAGRKGCAITFFSEDDARYAPDLVKALELSEQVVPQDLKALADGFMAKVNQGLEQAHGTGYGGSGFKFNEEEDEKRMAAKKAQAREYGFEEEKSDSEDEDDVVRKAGGDISQQTALAQQIAALAAVSKVPCTRGTNSSLCYSNAF
ncbi:DEAD-BOX ATP-DEPENDENT RNA HELICASE 42-LIKE [Salix purpurea]|uniref:DEAD-BOX ATP-DEPENDENT RNA HELICASE 42-LIKE n=1 Tax=Salix purpurea TaxID=77065 RepID=A0A9Q0WUY7_SALPP|nr:DEAD-BOX ATP-DEPENDENT RNA HELICASE 42-LIKE [Salix purpurea]